MHVPARTRESFRPASARFAEHRTELLAIAKKLCRDVHDAQDLVQDTFERALRCSDRFHPDTNAGAWLTTILRRLFIDAHRKRAKKSFAPLTGNEPTPPPEHEPLWANVSAEELSAAMRALDEPFRTVFMLHAIEGRSYAEISRRLSIQSATVGTRLTRARRKLRKHLSERSGSCSR